MPNWTRGICCWAFSWRNTASPAACCAMPALRRRPCAGPSSRWTSRPLGDSKTRQPIANLRQLQIGSRTMWQRFTERARRAVFFAQEEAARLGENYISTEHLLLGLLRDNDSVAVRILEAMDCAPGHV